MNKEQYEQLRHVAPQPQVITASDLQNQSDRTLIYGYTLDRATFHVYLKDGAFNIVVYSGTGDYAKLINSKIEQEVIHPELTIPSKRVYPRHSDYEYCKLVKSMGLDIPFTTFEDQPDRIPYAGLTYEELRE